MDKQNKHNPGTCWPMCDTCVKRLAFLRMLRREGVKV